MSYHNTQRLFALLTAVLVVCSFLAVPAAGASDTVDWDDDLDDSSSSSDTDSTDSGSDDSDDGSDGETSDTSDSEESDSGDGGSSTDESDTEENDTTEDAVDETTDALEDTTDGLDDTTDGLDDTTETATDTIDDTTNTVRTSAGESIETLALEAPFTTPSTIDRDDTTYLQMATQSTLQVDVEGATTESGADTSRTSAFRTAAADADDADDGSAVAMSANAAGGQPLPSAPLGVGGAAVSLSLLAGLAALRTTPLLGGSLPSLSAIGSGISTPAILSKLRPFLFPLRYSRYDDSDPLEHEAREEVYEIVNESPGSYLSEVSEEADLPLSTTRHHIKILEREDLVSGAKLRGKRRFYPAYAEGVELAAALNDEATASIIDAIARLGSASVSDLADDIDRDPSTISHHLQRLEEDGIITREREGRAVMNKLSGEARTALEPDSTPKPGEASGAVAGGAD